MQKTFLTFSLFILAALMTACSTSQITDEMAVVGDPSLSSDPCAAIDEKVLKLDRFTEVVKNTSAFYLQEEANAIQTPGITVSNDKKQMLKDAKRKYAEYEAERQKYGCKTPVREMGQTTEKLAILDQCTALDERMIRLDRFTEVVKHTSAFYLEEKANAIAVPEITVSTNKSQMLKDAKRKYAEYEAERKKYGCKAFVSDIDTAQISEKTSVATKAALPSTPPVVTETKPLKSNDSASMLNSSSTVEPHKKAVVPSVSPVIVDNAKVQTTEVEEQKTPIPAVEHPKQSVPSSMSSQSTQVEEKMTDAVEPTGSSEACYEIKQELRELNEFTNMVNNTSSFHLEEKIRAMPSPGFTVSNNKKKMLRDAEKKRKQLSAEYKKSGCDL